MSVPLTAYESSWVDLCYNVLSGKDQGLKIDEIKRELPFFVANNSASVLLRGDQRFIEIDGKFSVRRNAPSQVFNQPPPPRPSTQQPFLSVNPNYNPPTQRPAEISMFDATKKISNANTMSQLIRKNRDELFGGSIFDDDYQPPPQPKPRVVAPSIEPHPSVLIPSIIEKPLPQASSAAIPSVPTTLVEKVSEPARQQQMPSLSTPLPPPPGISKIPAVSTKDEPKIESKPAPQAETFIGSNKPEINKIPAFPPSVKPTSTSSATPSNLISINRKPMTPTAPIYSVRQGSRLQNDSEPQRRGSGTPDSSNNFDSSNSTPRVESVNRDLPNAHKRVSPPIPSDTSNVSYLKVQQVEPSNTLASTQLSTSRKPTITTSVTSTAVTTASQSQSNTQQYGQQQSSQPLKQSTINLSQSQSVKPSNLDKNNAVQPAHQVDKKGDNKMSQPSPATSNAHSEPDLSTFTPQQMTLINKYNFPPIPVGTPYNDCLTELLYYFINKAIHKLRNPSNRNKPWYTIDIKSTINSQVFRNALPSVKIYNSDLVYTDIVNGMRNEPRLKFDNMFRTIDGVCAEVFWLVETKDADKMKNESKSEKKIEKSSVLSVPSESGRIVTLVEKTPVVSEKVKTQVKLQDKDIKKMVGNTSYNSLSSGDTAMTESSNLSEQNSTFPGQNSSSTSEFEQSHWQMKGHQNNQQQTKPTTSIAMPLTTVTNSNNTNLSTKNNATNQSTIPKTVPSEVLATVTKGSGASTGSKNSPAAPTSDKTAQGLSLLATLQNKNNVQKTTEILEKKSSFVEQKSTKSEQKSSFMEVNKDSEKVAEQPVASPSMVKIDINSLLGGRSLVITPPSSTQNDIVNATKQQHQQPQQNVNDNKPVKLTRRQQQLEEKQKKFEKQQQPILQQTVSFVDKSKDVKDINKPTADYHTYYDSEPAHINSNINTVKYTNKQQPQPQQQQNAKSGKDDYNNSSRYATVEPPQSTLKSSSYDSYDNYNDHSNSHFNNDRNTSNHVVYNSQSNDHYDSNSNSIHYYTNNNTDNTHYHNDAKVDSVNMNVPAAVRPPTNSNYNPTDTNKFAAPSYETEQREPSDHKAYVANIMSENYNIIIDLLVEKSVCKICTEYFANTATYQKPVKLWMITKSLGINDTNPLFQEYPISDYDKQFITTDVIEALKTDSRVRYEFKKVGMLDYVEVFHGREVYVPPPTKTIVGTASASNSGPGYQPHYDNNSNSHAYNNNHSINTQKFNNSHSNRNRTQSDGSTGSYNNSDDVIRSGNYGNERGSERGRGKVGKSVHYADETVANNNWHDNNQDVNQDSVLVSFSQETNSQDGLDDDQQNNNNNQQQQSGRGKRVRRHNRPQKRLLKTA